VGVQIFNPQQCSDSYLHPIFSDVVMHCVQFLSVCVFLCVCVCVCGEKLLYKGHDSKEAEVRYLNKSSFSGVHKRNVLSLSERRNEPKFVISLA